MNRDCPVSWEHDDPYLDECEVCGYRGPPPPAPSGQDVVGWIRALNAVSCCSPDKGPEAA